MSGIWMRDEDGWKTAPPQDFKAEKELHGLVERNIQMLPLAGSPSLVVIGSEVPLGPGWADLVAVEMSGRPVIIEVKLGRNAKAKRAIVAQALAYAAWLRGHTAEDLERGPLQAYLKSQGCDSIFKAVHAQDQTSTVDEGTFVESMQEYLSSGAFRLVLLLDQTSVELERLVAYLDAVTRRAVTIDLITVSRYTIGGTEVALPQRVSPDVDATLGRSTAPGLAPQTVFTDDSEMFVASIGDVKEHDRRVFDHLLNWANDVADLPDVGLFSYKGVDGHRFTLLPRFKSEKAGLVTIWNDNGKPYISMWRSVFERRAPESIQRVEDVAGKKIGQGNVVSDITVELLEALTDAYREATAI